MIARLAYLTSPAPGVFVLNILPEGAEGPEGLQRFEISKAHLANIVITGTSLALREQYPNRVPDNKSTESANERAGT